MTGADGSAFYFLEFWSSCCNKKCLPVLLHLENYYSFLCMKKSFTSCKVMYNKGDMECPKKSEIPSKWLQKLGTNGYMVLLWKPVAYFT